MANVPEEVRTDRLVLSRWRAADATELRALLDRCDAHLRPWIPFMQDEPRSLEGTREKLIEIGASFDAGEHFRFALRERATEALVGETMLIGRGGPGAIEAGYWLDQRHCGKGYASEATAALLPLAFETLARQRVLVRCDVRNEPSLRVAARLGGVAIDTEQLEENGETVVLRVFQITPTR
ncbi:MAG: GNAT family N-acetyltransferase [Planctomycetota bacterium]